MAETVPKGNEDATNEQTSFSFAAVSNVLEARYFYFLFYFFPVTKVSIGIKHLLPSPPPK